MKLIEVSISKPKEIAVREHVVVTGIFKEPVHQRVMLRALNLDGDGQADLQAHGGPNRAVYVYTIEDYAHWERELGRTDLKIPQFGENFTVEGMSEDDVHVGDVFRVGDAMVQVTQPRVPCYKLAIKMNDPRFLKKFLQSGRTGFYLRVLKEGEVGAGDAIELIQADPEKMSIRKISYLYYFDAENLEDTRKAVRIQALSPGWREGFQERLDEAGAA